MNHEQEYQGERIAGPPLPPQGGRALLAMASRMLDLIYVWQTRIDERRELFRLDERLLKDAGLSRADVLHEAHKPFWRP